MGLMSGLSRGLSTAGYAAADMYGKQAMEEQRAKLEEEKMLRIDEVTRGRSRADKTWEQTELRPLMRQNALDDSSALAKQKPELAGYEAEAENAKLEATAPVKARLDRETSREKILSESTPEMLDAKRKIAKAGHFESLSSIESANLSRFQRQQLQEAAGLQKEYQAAIDSGDEERIGRATRKLNGGKVERKDAGDFLRAATQMLKEAPNADSPEETAEMKATAKLLFKLGGVDPSGGKKEAPPPPPAAAIEYLKNNPGTAAQFKAKYPGFDMSSIEDTKARSRTSSGLIKP